MNNADMPAHPIFNSDGASTALCLRLTKREYFAAAAMQGSLAGDVGDDLTIEDIATQARQIADALLAQLNELNTSPPSP